MGTHRREKPGRRAAPPPGRRRATRATPRYGRLAVLGASLSVTGVAVLGSVGVFPSVAQGGGDDSAGLEPASVRQAADPPASPSPTPEPQAQTQTQVSPAAPVVPEEPAAPEVPEESGQGRRIVFDQGDQRVWLVREDDTVARTYLVSGSTYDNLFPGSYEVYSRSAHATGIEQSGTMRYFVRFTQGTGGSAIGFHDIPLHDGDPVQTTDQLGTPLSHGCIRQARKDATALWGFAPIGTPVVVTA